MARRTDAALDNVPLSVLTRRRVPARGPTHPHTHTHSLGTQVLEHIHHTKPKSVSEHVDKMISANKKMYDAFTPGSKRLMIWQSQPSLH